MNEAIEAENLRCMAECMDMVRQELIEAGIIDKSTPPMMVANGVVYYMKMQAQASEAEAKYADEMHCRAILAEAESKHWKANHENQVSRARILIERLDLPIERVKAYELMGQLQEENDILKTELIAAYERCELVSEEAKRFEACRHAAKTMPEDGGEEVFLIEIDKYRIEHGI